MIPKKIHFVYGLRADFNKLDFSLMHWAAIKSAIKVNPGYEIHYWYQTLPETYYFDSIRDLLILHKIEAPSEIFGNPLNHFAHQADVVRMLVLQREGAYISILIQFVEDPSIRIYQTGL